MGRTGYRCFLESPEASSKLGRLEPVRLELGVSGWYGGWLGWLAPVNQKTTNVLLIEVDVDELS